jgi:hypothetical protein
VIDTALVAERHATAKPGFRLLECEPAALPFFSLTVPAIVQQRKQVPPVDEFVMRGVARGIVSPEAICDFLGLEEGVVARALARLWQADLVDFPAISGSRELRLTNAGIRTLEELIEVSPQEQDVWFTFDRLRWRPATVHPAELLQPRDVRDLGMTAIRPKKLARPDVEDLPLALVDRALKACMRGALGDAELLVVKRVDRAEQKYLPCHLLVYEALDSSDHAFEIAVDGRIDHEVASAIDGLGGASHIGLQFDAPASSDLSEVAAVREAVSKSDEPVASLEEVEAIRRESAPPDAPEAEASQSRNPLTGRAAAIDAIVARNIDTFEHRPYLVEALTTSRRRLLITSPWVRNAVVNKEMLDHLWSLARRGVQIHIGYGITPDAKDCDPAALDRLAKLHDRFENVIVGCLGDTHAKILIWDDAQIITSFNWLSFRGDQDRTYRQETGVLLKNNRTGIEPFYQEQRAAIEKVARKADRDS